MQDKLLTVRELSEYLGVHSDTVYRWGREGIGPVAIKIGKTFRYRESDIVKYLDENAAEVQAKALKKYLKEVRNGS